MEEEQKNQETARTESRIEDLWGQLPIVTTTPTWVPRKFRDGFAIDSTAAKFYYYDYTNNVWRTVYPDGVGGDASTNTSTSVDSEIALFSSTTGKLLKRATTTGILKAASGVIGAATAGTDYIENYNDLLGLFTNFDNYWKTTGVPINGSFGWNVTGTPSYRVTGTSVGNATNAKAYLEYSTRNTSSGNPLQFTTGPLVKVKYMWLAGQTSQGTTPIAGTDRASFHGFGGTGGADTYGDITDVSTRAGFAYYNNILYTVTADGSAVTSTNHGAEPGTSAPKEFAIVADFSTPSIAFYMNGTLLATHTTNVPNAASTIYLTSSTYDASGGSTNFFMGTPIVSVKIA